MLSVGRETQLSCSAFQKDHEARMTGLLQPITSVPPPGTEGARQLRPFPESGKGQGASRKSLPKDLHLLIEYPVAISAVGKLTFSLARPAE